MAASTPLRFDVRSAKNAAIFLSERSWAAISVSSAAHFFPTLSEANRIGLLRLVFEDTVERSNPASFSDRHAEEILDFVEGIWRLADVLLIHCEVGLSRSPAIAAALSRLYFDDDGPWSEFDFMNRLVYQMLVESGRRRVE